MYDKSSGEKKNNRLVSILGSLPDRNKITLNRKVLIFLFFLMLSVLFWFLTILNKDYNAPISYPVRYIRLPEDQVLVNEVPDRLELMVNARGYTLLRYRIISRLAPIVFDVNSFALSILDNDPSQVYILTSYAKDRISKQLSADIKILDVSPDSLIFRFSEKVSRHLPIEPRLRIGFQKQYMQVGPVLVEPDSVLVSGPAAIIDTIGTIGTEYAEYVEVNKNIDIFLKLSSFKNIGYSTEKVHVVVPVEKFTEAELNIPVEVVNLPDSLVMKTFPREIRLTFQVGLSAFENVSIHSFRAVVDYSRSGSQLGSKLPVQLMKMPDFVQSVNFSPSNVEYILER